MGGRLCLSGSKLVECRAEVTLPRGECRLPCGQPRLELVDELLERTVGHGPIVLPASDATAAAHRDCHEREEHARRCTDSGADGDQPGERRPGRGGRGSRLRGEPKRGILVALEAA